MSRAETILRQLDETKWKPKGKGKDAGRGPMPQGKDVSVPDKLAGTEVNPQRDQAKGKKIGKTGHVPRGFAQ